MEETQLAVGKNCFLEICHCLALCPLCILLPPTREGPGLRSLLPSLAVLVCSLTVPSCSFLWTSLASTVYLFPCQPLSLPMVVNRAADCQPRACAVNLLPVDSGMYSNSDSCAQKRLWALAQAVQKVLLLTIQMELYRQEHHVTCSLHPSSLLFPFLPP
jgi:hypothetical protein